MLDKPIHTPLRRLRHETQCGGRNNSKSPFRTDQQLFEIETAIVFLERDEVRENGTIRQHTLQAENLRTHGTVAQDLRAPGIR